MQFLCVVVLVLLHPSLASAQHRGASASEATQPSEAQENLFWQSIMNSANPADFEAYLRQFPTGVFRLLAENRLAALRAGQTDPSEGADSASTAGDAARRGLEEEVFRDCDDVCPEMVVMPGGGLALGRYEVTVGEYRVFVSATDGGGEASGCLVSWQDPGFPQTDRHPVVCVSWNDAQAYVSWLSQTTGATYRLPSEEEWEQAAAGSQRGCDRSRTGNSGTCPVGSYGPNGAGLFDMVGNAWEWTEYCWEGDCSRRVLRGGSWDSTVANLRPGARFSGRASYRGDGYGFRVARTLD